MNLFIAPHEDDEALFGAYTLMREKPLVLLVTDSFIQAQRGDGITAEQRRNETIAAMKILGCSVLFGGIPDTQVNEENLFHLFSLFHNFDEVYIPAIIENGNPHHNLIGYVGAQIWPNAIRYMSYSRTNLLKMGKTEIEPTLEEIDLKNKALDCYVSQINLGSTRPHFDAVRGRSEWYE